MRIGEPDLRLPVGRDTVGLPVAHVVEEEFALGVGRGALGELVAFANEPPVLARNENLLKLRAAQSGGHRLRPATPKPCKHFRKQLRGVLAVVATVAPRVPHVIPGEFERPLHRLIGHPPVAAVDVEVVRAVLQEYPQRLRLNLADERGIGVASPEADIRADATVDTGKGVGPFPGRREGRDRTAGGAADRAVVAALREHDGSAIGGFLRLDGWQDFLQKKAGVVGAEAVVLEAPVEPVERSLLGRGHDSRLHEDADHHRDLLLGDQPVEHLGGIELDAVLVDVHAGWRRAVVLLRHIDRNLPGRARENLARVEPEGNHLALGYGGCGPNCRGSRCRGRRCRRSLEGHGTSR